MKNVSSDSTALPPELRSLLAGWAEWIVERRLETPALLFLELHLPLTTLCHTAYLLVEPIATPLFGSERTDLWREVLSDRQHLERLIEEIETRTALRNFHGAC